MDIGAWFAPGPVLRNEPYNSRAQVRKFEQYLRENRGYQCLYACIEQTRDEYRQMFDCSLYDHCRAKYKADGVFMDTFDKIARPWNRSTASK